MYAKQVVNSLTSKNELELAQKIESAHKFHFGETGKLPNPSREFLFLDFKEFIKLPYQNCWFDFYFTSSSGLFVKIGLLLQELADKTIFVHLYFRCRYSYPVWVSDYSFLLDIATGRIKFLSCQEQDLSNSFDDSSVHNFFNYILTVMENCILLLNCKNIELVNNFPDLKHIKERIKRGIKSTYSYYTLKLKLSARKQTSRGQQQESQNHNRLHFCRGHFKQYTVDAPLFGKITGLWWWQSLMRGQNKQGLIEKEYAIK